MISQAQRFSRFFAATILAFSFLLLMDSVAWGQNQPPTTILISSPFPNSAVRNPVFGGQFSNISGNANTVVYETNSMPMILARDVTAISPELISINFNNNTSSTGQFSGASTTTDGRVVVYQTTNTDLFNTNGLSNIVLFNRATGGAELISKTIDGSPATGNSTVPAITSDGSRVVFASTSVNLTGDTITMTAIASNIFLRDRNSNTTTLISKINGMPFNVDCGTPSIADDGTIVFQSNGRIFVYTPQDQKVTQVSTTDVQPAFHPTISRTGGVIAFQSQGGVNGPSIVFAQAGTSNLSPGFIISDIDSSVNAHSTVGPVLSNNGNVVAFSSRIIYETLMNGTPPTLKPVSDVFVTASGSTTFERINIGDNGQSATATSQSPSISDNGRFVSFDSFSILTNDTKGGSPNVYLRDRGSDAGGGIGGAGTVSVGVVCPNKATATANTASISWAIHSNPKGSRIKILRFDQTGNYKIIADLAGEDAGNGYTDTDLTPGTVYTYRVWVTDAGKIFPTDFTIKTKKIKHKK